MELQEAYSNVFTFTFRSIAMSFKLEIGTYVNIQKYLIIWILLFSVTTTTRNCLKLVIYFVILFIESTSSGVEEYEQIEVDETAGPGPQRCKIFLDFLFEKNFSFIMKQKYYLE